MSIDVDQHTITVSGGKGEMHMNFIHGKGKWNQKWMNSIDNNPNVTDKDIYQFAGKMIIRKKYINLYYKPGSGGHGKGDLQCMFRCL